MGGVFVFCFLLDVRSPSSRGFRLRDLFSLFPETPAVLLVEPKYESIGSSPATDERGLMEVYNQDTLSGQPVLISAPLDAFILTRLDDIILV